jgi:hypothetical protein
MDCPKIMYNSWQKDQLYQIIRFYYTSFYDNTKKKEPLEVPFYFYNDR